MVTSAEVMRAFGIPSNTLYRLARKGVIPAVEVTKPWHARRRWLFRLSEVRAWIESRQTSLPYPLDTPDTPR